MKKLISLALLLTLLSNVTFAEKPKQPKEPRYKLGRKLNRVAIVVVGTAFLINIISKVK
jgi:hypothetical protein